MVGMIVALDHVLWWPVVAWSQRFRLEESSHQTVMTSWFLEWLQRSRLRRFVRLRLHRRQGAAAGLSPAPTSQVSDSSGVSPWAARLSILASLGLLAALLFGTWNLVLLLRVVTLAEWGETCMVACWTLARVLVSTALGTL